MAAANPTAQRVPTVLPPYYRRYELPWSPSEEMERRFRTREEYVFSGRTNMRAERRVLMLGFDAAEYALIHSLIARGKLPVLARLMQRGCTGRLNSPASYYSGAVWPTFYTGQAPPWPRLPDGAGRVPAA